MATIKAGTYVFVEEPTITEAYNQTLNYKVHYLTAENVYATNTYNAIKLSTTVTWGGTITCSRAENTTEYPLTGYVGNSKRWQSSPDDSSNFFATDNTKLRTIIVETDQTVADNFYTWFTANTALQPKLSIDLTTLPGWANLSAGNHTIKIKAKGTGYIDSELSTGVTVSKAASIPALADATWEQINQVSQAGTASNYWAVGDEKTFTLSTGEAVTVQILGFNHDDLADGSGKAGITFGMKNLLTTGYPTNSSNTNVGGWDSSYARTSIMPTFLGQLPSDLQNVIKEVNKKTSQGNRSSSIITSVDKLFLLSHIELMGTNKYKTDADAILSAQGEGVQYDYYKNAIIPTPVSGSNKFTALSGNTGTFYTPNTSNASSYINSFGETKTTAANFYYNYNNAKSSGSSATAGAWGLRSPYLGSSDHFAYVNADGNVASMKASNKNCRWFGFCV